MVRVRRILWVSAFLFFVAVLLVRVGVSVKDPGHGVVLALILGFALLVLTALVTTGVALLLAIPMNSHGDPFRQRVWLRLPFALAASVILMSVAAFLPEWWEGKHGMKAVAGSNYADVPVAGSTECGSVKEGVFFNDGIRIERHGDSQFQKDKVFGIEEDAEVSWLGPCEYALFSGDSLGTRYVKITKVDINGYDCMVFGDTSAGIGYAMRFERE